MPVRARGSCPTGVALTAEGINPNQGHVEIQTPRSHLRRIEHGTGLYELPFAERDDAKAIFRSTDIHTDNDRSTRSSTHRRSSLKCRGNPSKSGNDVEGTERERRRSAPTARPSTWRAADKRNDPWAQRYSQPGKRVERGLLVSSARATRGRGRKGKERPGALLARRAPTMKQWSLDARSGESTRPTLFGPSRSSRMSRVEETRRLAPLFPPCLPVVGKQRRRQNRFMTHFSNVFLGGPSPTAAHAHFCFATIFYLIPSYVARGRIFFCTSSSFRWYGRPMMIFSE